MQDFFLLVREPHVFKKDGMIFSGERPGRLLERRLFLS